MVMVMENNDISKIEYLQISSLFIVESYTGPKINNPNITIMKTKKVLTPHKITIGGNGKKGRLTLLKRKKIYEKISEMYLDKEEDIYEKCSNTTRMTSFEIDLRIVVGQRSICKKLIEEEEFLDKVENENTTEYNEQKDKEYNEQKDNNITEKFSNLQISEMEKTKIYG